MGVPVYIKENHSQSQTIWDKDVNTPIIENDISILIDKSSSTDNEEKLRTARGIIWAIIFCIPFWLLFLKFIGWLLQLF